jgi:hypothetical protein
MRRVTLVLACAVAVVFLLNRQVLRETVLVNSPSYDALVYQNQSYEDYTLIRDRGLSALASKYTDGRWSAPPLYPLLGTLAYLLFGRDPANFYITPAIGLFFLVLGTYGFVHHWTGARRWAILATLLIATVPSVVTFGLRVSQIDFAVGALFTWATYVLVVSDGLRRRSWALVYAVTGGVCLLLKSSIVLYFLAHALIWSLYLLADAANRRVRVLHAAGVIAIVLLLSGWFYVTNFRQITAYYTAFGTTLSNISSPRGAGSTAVDEVLFYWRSFSGFHEADQHLRPYEAAIALGGVALLLVAVLRRCWLNARACVGLLTAAIWLAVPYAILSVYASKANAVDFPFLAAFFVIPILVLASAGNGALALVAPLAVMPLVLSQLPDQVHNLTVADAVPSWREAEILGDLLADASRRGLRDVNVTNDFVSGELTSENLRFFVDNGTFSSWQGHYHVLPLTYYFDADSYYRFLLTADYVLAKTGNLAPPQHPDNLLTPALNERLAHSSEMEQVESYDLPDGTQLLLYRNVARRSVSYPKPMPDGWIAPRLPVTLQGPAEDRRLRLTGSAPLPGALAYPVHLMLERADGQPVTAPAAIPDGSPFSVDLVVPAGALARSGGSTVLYLTSDRAFRPADYGVSSDGRLLMLRLTGITDDDP